MEKIFFITEKDSEDNTDTAARIISEKARALRNDNKTMKIGYLCKTHYRSKKMLQKLSDKTDSDLSTDISKISQMSLLFTEDDRQQKNDINMYPIALNDPMWSKGSKTGATINDRAYAFWLTPYKAENGAIRLLIEDYSDKKYYFQLRKNISNYPIDYNFDEDRFDIWKDAFFGVSHFTFDNCNILIDAANQLLNTSLIEKFKELLINNSWEEKLCKLIKFHVPVNFFNNMSILNDSSIVKHTEDTPFTVFLIKQFRNIYTGVSNKIIWDCASNVCNDWMEFIIGCMKELNSEYMNFDLILIDENIYYSDVKARIEEADKLRYAQNNNNKDKMKISILEKPDVYIIRSDRSDKGSDEQTAENSFDKWYGNNVKENILKGKILVVGNNDNGRTLLFREAERRRNQGGIAGVEQKSIVEIALPIVAEALAKSKSIDELKRISVQPISGNTASGIIMSMIRRESKFSREMLTKNTADELLRIINMFRMNECTDRVKTEGFDVWQLKDEYEKFLNDKGLYDSARLLSEAVGYLEGQGNKDCILCPCRIYSGSKTNIKI